jgi:hypothetical protein
MKTARLLLFLVIALPCAAFAIDLPRAVERTVRDGWVGYRIPDPARYSFNCATDWAHNWRNETPSVIFLIRDGAVTRVRLYAETCEEPAARDVHWLTDVDTASSVAYLRSLVDGDHSVADGALSALWAHHGSTDALLDVAKHNPSAHVRGKALFWLSQQAGEKVAPALREAIDRDPDTRVKEQAVFGISNLPDDQSIPLLVDIVRNNRNPAVRKKAVFWLGQKRDPRALAAIEDILR